MKVSIDSSYLESCVTYFLCFCFLVLSLFLCPQWATLTKSGASTVRMSRRWASTPSPWRTLLTTTGRKNVKERGASIGVAGTTGFKRLSAAVLDLMTVNSDSSKPVGCAFGTCHCHFHSTVLIQLPQCLSGILFRRRDEKNVRKGWEKCRAHHGSDCSKCPTAQHHPQVN